MPEPWSCRSALNRSVWDRHFPIVEGHRLESARRGGPRVAAEVIRVLQRGRCDSLPFEGSQWLGNRHARAEARWAGLAQVILAATRCRQAHLSADTPYSAASNFASAAATSDVALQVMSRVTAALSSKALPNARCISTGGQRDRGTGCLRDPRCSKAHSFSWHFHQKIFVQV